MINLKLQSPWEREAREVFFPFQIIYIAISPIGQLGPCSQEMFTEFLLFSYFVLSESSPSSPMVQPPISRPGNY